LTYFPPLEKMRFFLRLLILGQERVLFVAEETGEGEVPVAGYKRRDNGDRGEGVNVADGGVRDKPGESA
jgi:hypothetical protein